VACIVRAFNVKVRLYVLAGTIAVYALRLNL